MQFRVGDKAFADFRNHKLNGYILFLSSPTRSYIMLQKLILTVGWICNLLLDIDQTSVMNRTCLYFRALRTDTYIWHTLGSHWDRIKCESLAHTRMRAYWFVMKYIKYKIYTYARVHTHIHIYLYKYVHKFSNTTVEFLLKTEFPYKAEGEY